MRKGWTPVAGSCAGMGQLRINRACSWAALTLHRLYFSAMALRDERNRLLRLDASL